VTYFAAVLARRADRWRAIEVDVQGCESVTDLADVALDVDGDLRLLLIEQDDEYAAIIRLDTQDDEPRVFLSDGHAGDNYPLAAVLVEDLLEVGAGGVDGSGAGRPTDDGGILDDAPPAHDSAPFGDAGIVADLGTPAGELLEMCAREGTLPIEVLAYVAEQAGCGDEFDDLRG
jgi:putative tRNA adenosine deaminase-associated protein